MHFKLWIVTQTGKKNLIGVYNTGKYCDAAAYNLVESLKSDGFRCYTNGMYDVWVNLF